MSYLSAGNTENIQNIHLWCWTGIAIRLLCFLLLFIPCNSSSSHIQRRKGEGKSQSKGSRNVLLYTDYISKCITVSALVVSSDMGSWQPWGSRKHILVPHSDIFLLILGLGTVYSKGDSRELTTDGKNPNLLPTGLLNTANCWQVGSALVAAFSQCAALAGLKNR